MRKFTEKKSPYFIFINKTLWIFKSFNKSKSKFITSISKNENKTSMIN